ncbi:single-stranded DNA-binding protein [Patescibacteria group bacterium]|nr:single-stranded DNA-binding protein [Patescibacteria group bacterium]
MYLNKAIVIGNITRDPEIKSLPSGIKVASFSVATNRVWKDKNGAKQENVDYHNIVVFGKQAEIVGQYMKKGSSILVEGRMQTRSWDDAGGVKKYRTEIITDRIQFGPRPAGGGAPSGSYGGAAQAPEDNNKKAMDTIEYPEEEINPEDIPF